MVGYELGKTVSEHGSVTRGICEMDAGGYLTAIREQGNIRTCETGICFLSGDEKTWKNISPTSLVSMNMWGFRPRFLQELKDRFPGFLSSAGRLNPQKAEFLLPTTVGHMLRNQNISVRVLHSEDKWYGVTYAEDRAFVVQALEEETRQGKYPAEGLWAAKE